MLRSWVVSVVGGMVAVGEYVLRRKLGKKRALMKPVSAMRGSKVVKKMR